jgi:hypothetical protein
MIPAPNTKLTLSFIYLFLFLSFTPTVLGQTAVTGGSGISAIPPRLEATVEPDGANTYTLKVRNESPNARDIKVSLRDFIVTDNQGTPNFLDDLPQNLNNRWSASSWIQVSPSQLSLKPGETKTVRLTVMPPLNALPGGHYAAVIYTPDAFSLYNTITGSSIQTNVGTLLYITIPGDINQNASVVSFSAPKFSEFGPIDFTTTIKNSSDIHIQPVGAITVKNWFGRKTGQVSLDGTNIFPYTTRDFKNTLNKKWLFGRYQADLKAAYGSAGGLVTATLFFWVIPWRLIILIIAALAIITTLIFIIKHQPKKPKKTDDQVAQLEKELAALKKKYSDN